MENLSIYANLADGGMWPVELASGRDLVLRLFGDDWAAPPVVLVIEATAEDGSQVRVTVAKDERTRANVSIGPPRT